MSLVPQEVENLRQLFHSMALTSNYDPFRSYNDGRGAWAGKRQRCVLGGDEVKVAYCRRGVAGVRVE